MEFMKKIPESIRISKISSYKDKNNEHKNVGGFRKTNYLS